MKTIMLFAALALVGAAMTYHAVACDHQATHAAAAQSATVVACADGKCAGQAPTTQQGNGGTEAR